MTEAFIKQMSFSDLDALMVIEQAAFKIPWTRGMLEDELYNRNAWYRVITFEGAIAGYAGMWKILDEGHITNVAIHPHYQRKGLATLLMQDLIDHAASSAIQAITLEVRVSNNPAIKLYESFGFKTEGRRKHYYADNHEDALIMWLKLNLGE